MTNDVRWVQLFQQYKKALQNLSDAVELDRVRKLSKLEEQGLIKAFELVHELSWLVIKDYYQDQGDVAIQGSKDAIRLAFKRGLIDDGEAFMQSIKTRQLTVHTYNEETAHKIHTDIIDVYYGAFKKLAQKLEIHQCDLGL